MLSSDFMREHQIGHIAGEPVIGLLDWDEVAGAVQLPVDRR